MVVKSKNTTDDNRVTAGRFLVSELLLFLKSRTSQATIRKRINLTMEKLLLVILSYLILGVLCC